MKRIVAEYTQAERELSLTHLLCVGHSAMGCRPEELRVSCIETRGHKGISGDVVVEKHLVPHAGAEILACRAGVMTVHDELRAAIWLLLPLPAHVQGVGLIRERWPLRFLGVKGFAHLVTPLGIRVREMEGVADRDSPHMEFLGDEAIRGGEALIHRVLCGRFSCGG